MCCWVCFSCCQTQPGRKAGPVTDGGARGRDDGGPEGVLPAASAGFLWGQDRVSVCCVVCVCVWGGVMGDLYQHLQAYFGDKTGSVCVGGVNEGLKAFSLWHLQSSFGDNTGWVFLSSDME